MNLFNSENRYSKNLPLLLILLLFISLRRKNSALPFNESFREVSKTGIFLKMAEIVTSFLLN